MADKVAKPKKSKSKAKKDEKGVLAALPSTRPERIGSRRGAKPAASAAVAKPASAKPAKPAAAKRQAGPRDRRAPQGGRAAHVRADRGRRGGVAADRRSHARAAGVTPQPRAPRPRAVREGAPGMGTTSPDRDQPSAESGRPSGVELVTTAVQAAGEITQIGLTIGGRIIKRAVDRLPKP